MSGEFVSAIQRPRIMVAGSRGWDDYALVLTWMGRMRESYPDLIVMHGGADGADLQAEAACNELGIDLDPPYLPDKRRPSPQRFHERNDLMLGRAWAVIAFWDRSSHGTKSVIDKAKARGVPLTTVFARPIPAPVQAKQKTGALTSPK